MSTDCAGFAYPRFTLIYVKSTQNVTLSLPEPLLRRFRIYAATRNKSMTQLIMEAIRALLEQEEGLESQAPILGSNPQRTRPRHQGQDSVDSRPVA